jgi:hypothetical protein
MESALLPAAQASAQQPALQAAMLPTITKQSNEGTAKSVQLPLHQKEQQRPPSGLAEANGTDSDSDGDGGRPPHHSRHSKHRKDRKRRSASSEPRKHKHERRHRQEFDEGDDDDHGSAHSQHNEHGRRRASGREREPHRFETNDSRGSGRGRSPTRTRGDDRDAARRHDGSYDSYAHRAPPRRRRETTSGDRDNALDKEYVMYMKQMVEQGYDSEEVYNAYGIKPPPPDIFRHKSGEKKHPEPVPPSCFFMRFPSIYAALSKSAAKTDPDFSAMYTMYMKQQGTNAVPEQPVAISFTSEGAVFTKPKASATTIPTFQAFVLVFMAVGRELGVLMPDAVGVYYDHLLVHLTMAFASQNKSLSWVIGVADLHLKQFFQALRGNIAVPALAYSPALAMSFYSNDYDTAARGQAAPPGPPTKRRDQDLRNTLNAPPAARQANGTIKFTGDTTAAARQQCNMALNKRPCKWADPCPYNHITHPAVPRT